MDSPKGENVSNLGTSDSVETEYGSFEDPPSDESMKDVEINDQRDFQ